MNREPARQLETSAPSSLQMLEGGMDSEALFKEARRRRRLRWLFGSLIAAVILVVVTFIATAHGVSGGHGPTSASGSAAPQGSQFFTVQAGSMEPTLVIGDRVEATQGIVGLKRGDVVVFKLPTTIAHSFSASTMIKRIVGLPGETISSSGANVVINGFPLPEPYLGSGRIASAAIPKQTIPAGEYFVLGDNRSDSMDSRIFGPIPSASILGIATRIVSPPTRSGPILGSSN